MIVITNEESIVSELDRLSELEGRRTHSLIDLDTQIMTARMSGDERKKGLLNQEETRQLDSIQAHIQTLLNAAQEIHDRHANEYQVIEQQIIDQETRLTNQKQDITRSLSAEIETLKAWIIMAVTGLGKSVKGHQVHAIYSKGRDTWNTDALRGYAAAHSEIMAFCKTGKPSVSFRSLNQINDENN